MKAKTYHLTTAPPSLNNAYRNAMFARGGRYKSKQYKEWLQAAGWELKAQGVQKVSGTYGLDIQIGKGLSRADVDNLIKPISDLMVKMGATQDDRSMVSVSIRYTQRQDVRVRVFQDSLEKAA